jgi:hypothetical protein
MSMTTAPVTTGGRTLWMTLDPGSGSSADERQDETADEDGAGDRA